MLWDHAALPYPRDTCILNDNPILSDQPVFRDYKKTITVLKKKKKKTLHYPYLEITIDSWDSRPTGP